jgi:tartrate dehydratase alpha subunit/fumarate hydratase class I-like protein
MGKKAHDVLTEGSGHGFLPGGAYDAYAKLKPYYSQVAHTYMFHEKNAGNNLPPARLMNTSSSLLPRVVVVQTTHFCINRPRHY